jgi:hypothetical protein
VQGKEKSHRVWKKILNYGKKRIKKLVKGKEILVVVQQELAGWHGARIKLVALFVLGVIKVGLVHLSKIARGVDTKAQKASVVKTPGTLPSALAEVDYGSGGTDHGLAGGGQVGVDAGSNGVEVGGCAGEHFDAGSGIPGRGSVLVMESVRSGGNE